jgi:ribonucleoside-diphosphate reductase alpha chain
MNIKNTQWIWESELFKEIFTQKYCLAGEQTAEAVFAGVAKEIASVETTPEARERWETIFYDELVSGRLQPAGRILANARPESPMKNYNNCFTIDIEDSLEGIYDSLKEDATISKMGGGVGFDISKLRPRGAKLANGGESSGVISFLRIFDQSAKTIMTGGQRRSAHIALLDISHPEIEDFITAKKGEQNKELTQFNISVKITDAFVKAVKDDADWDLVHRGKTYKTVKARYLYDLLAKNAYFHNEPGIFNSDTVERFNNGYWAFKMDRVNPCGELVMPSYSLCCLSSINLALFVTDAFTDKASFDFDAFAQTAAVGVRFLDDVLDATDYPLEKIKTFSRQWRRIGLGFTGLADVFAMLRVPYGSDESLALGARIGQTLRDASYSASSDLAREKGSFPAFDADKYLEANFLKTLPDSIRDKIRVQGMRNVQLNTVAPTGTTSLSMGQNCSSGIEPIFALSFKRTIRTGVGDETRTEDVSDWAWRRYLATAGATANAGATGGSNAGAGIEVPPFFATTVDIDPYRSIDMQAVFQKYIDHSISKTLNLPPATSFDEYKNLFMYGYDKGLKGFTTFNPDGSMKGILEYSEKKDSGIKRRLAPARPRDLPCGIHRIKNGSKSFLVITGLLDGSLYEIFVIDDSGMTIDLATDKKTIVRKAEKGRYDLVFVNGKEEIRLENFTREYDSPDASLARFISMALRHGTPLQFIVSQLQKDTNFTDVERSIARVLKSYIRDGEEVITSDGVCPECGEKLSFRDGCVSCFSCGYSKCS